MSQASTYKADRVTIGRISIDNITFEEAVARIIHFAQNARSDFVVTPNVDHVVNLEKDEEFRRVYEAASLVVADGMPLVWGSKLIRRPLKERITGADLLPRLCEEAAKHGLKVFFLGGPPGAADLASKKLCERWPALQVSGTYSPPFGFEKDQEENKKIIKLINHSSPNIVFVGLGAPKQEKWIFHHHEQLNVGVLLGIGAAIEFAAGTVKRAPRWVQKIGLEWFFRLCQEPRRLAKRYAKDVIFIFILLKTWLS